jgi:hypothetical protein
MPHGGNIPNFKRYEKVNTIRNKTRLRCASLKIPQIHCVSPVSGFNLDKAILRNFVLWASSRVVARTFHILAAWVPIEVLLWMPPCRQDASAALYIIRASRRFRVSIAAFTSLKRNFSLWARSMTWTRTLTGVDGSRQQIGRALRQILQICRVVAEYVIGLDKALGGVALPAQPLEQGHPVSASDLILEFLQESTGLDDSSISERINFCAIFVDQRHIERGGGSVGFHIGGP